MEFIGYLVYMIFSFCNLRESERKETFLWNSTNFHSMTLCIEYIWPDMLCDHYYVESPYKASRIGTKCRFGSPPANRMDTGRLLLLGQLTETSFTDKVYLNHHGYVITSTLNYGCDPRLISKLGLWHGWVIVSLIKQLDVITYPWHGLHKSQEAPEVK